MCKWNWCDYCGPRKAWGYGQLAAASRPERFVTLTLASEHWDVNRARVNNLVHELRRRGYHCQIYWAIEPNPRGTGNHIHALQHGDYVPQALLQSLWGAIVHIEAVTTEVGASAGGVAMYVVKGAVVAGYVTKGEGSDLPRHLHLNGNRSAHWSRGFMRTSDDDAVAAWALRMLLHKRAGDRRWVVAGQGESVESVRARIAFAGGLRDGYFGTEQEAS